MEKIEFDTELDLHFFHHDDTEMIVSEFLRQAIEKQLPKVRIAHGKGRSKIKFRVHSILGSHPDVLSFSDEGPNWGATIVLLNIPMKR